MVTTTTQQSGISPIPVLRGGALGDAGGNITYNSEDSDTYPAWLTQKHHKQQGGAPRTTGYPEVLRNKAAFYVGSSPDSSEVQGQPTSKTKKEDKLVRERLVQGH